MIRRTLRTLVTATCLLALTTLLAGAARSYRVGDYVGVTRNTLAPDALHSRTLDGVTGPGQILISFDHNQIPADTWRRATSLHDRYPTGTHFKYAPQPLGSLIDLGWDRTFLTRRGFLAESRTSSMSGASWSKIYLAFPFWFAALPFALPPALQLLHWRKRRARQRRGLCPNCAYDLRATPDHCPECGHDLAAAARPTPIRTWATRAALATACLAIAAALTLTTRSVQPLEIVRRPAVPRRPGTRPTPVFGDPVRVVITPRHRELARQIDPTRTYVFIPRVQTAGPARTQFAEVHLFARRAGRWRYTIRHLKAAQPLDDPTFPTDLTLKEFRPAADNDTLVLLATPTGQTLTHSTKADTNDPLRTFLIEMTSYSGQFLEPELFPQP